MIYLFTTIDVADILLTIGSILLALRVPILKAYSNEAITENIDKITSRKRGITGVVAISIIVICFLVSDVSRIAEDIPFQTDLQIIMSSIIRVALFTLCDVAFLASLKK